MTDADVVLAKVAKHGVIDEDLAGRLRRMVGFRNIAVHQYQALELAPTCPRCARCCEAGPAPGPTLLGPGSGLNL
jgi:hypothetical protein